MKKILIDTSFVVSLINPKDEQHKMAVRLSEEFDGHPAVVTDAVILEIGNSLSRSFKQDCIDTIDGLLESAEVEVVRLDESLFGKAFQYYKGHPDKTYGLVDCVSFVATKERGITDALTNDRHFVQAGFRALMRESIH